MCDSPILQTALSQSDALCKCPHSGVICNSHLRYAAGDKTSLQVRNLEEGTARLGSYIKSNNFLYRFQLEQDVRKLQQQLREEMELHTILENAIEKNALQISTSSCLPHYAQELLTTIAALEVTVSKLEQEMVSLHFQLSQERNERRLAEYRRKHPSPQLLSPRCTNIMNISMSPSLRCSKHSTSEQCLEDSSYQELRDQELELSGESVSMPSTTENAEDSVATCNVMGSYIKMDSESCQPTDFRKLPKGMPPKGLWDNPNQLSEEMVRCMKNIFMSLADSTMTPQSEGLENNSLSLSPRGHLSNSSWWSSERSMISSWVHSPQVDIQSNSEVLAFENVCDPYRVRGKLSWAEIGNYGLATEVSWMSVGKKQLEYAAGALRKFRVLVEQLAKVNPIHLNCNERLAFWINLYNALIMHAYLAYGVPRSELKLFSLMQKAAYTVGGHSFSAAAIEYVILKMKPPLHRPQIALLLALHKVKVSEEQRKSAMSTYEPLVAFALSCGMYSSPAVRIYTARNVREELEEAQLDFIRASVGISSKGRLLVPKMLHCFAKCFVDDANLAVWISHYLPPHQAAFVEQCISQRRQSILGSRNCGILPFDSRFRYLFLPDKVPLQ
ncbi:Ternary complex factor MIP1, leucine-zipper [Trema orientale]|uniref:Ternary complex factor MIP1, leucine-zipper n=1 Tax=Trema orientale TaxID=63057 RepID=A0A2P5C651_TREOI|nr:Ternary complex factor MIP1, leucine-zipper [Trema orientale]